MDKFRDQWKPNENINIVVEIEAKIKQREEDYSGLRGGDGGNSCGGHVFPADRHGGL